MRHWLSVRALLYVGATILAAAGVGNAFVAVFAPARYEVVYRFDATVSSCVDDLCAYSALLSVANTGRRPQEQLDIAIEGVPPGLASRPRFLNLDASFPRTADPNVEQDRKEGVLLIGVRNFMPGTLVQLPFRGTLRRSLLQQATEPEVTVHGRGRMIEGDPRSIAFGRWFTRSRPPGHGAARIAGAAGLCKLAPLPPRYQQGICRAKENSPGRIAERAVLPCRIRPQPAGASQRHPFPG